MDINKVLSSKEYNFINEDNNLKNRILFLTFGGSYSYGTNKLGSDIDIRGISINTPHELLGLSNNEQYIDNNTDTVIYRLNKVIPLLINCNPNTIEMLGCLPSHYSHISSEGQLLLDNRKLFLSLRAVNSFSGYATQQLRRLQNALARDHYPHKEKEEHILGSCNSAIRGFNNRYSEFDGGSFNLHIAPSDKSEFDSEIMANIHLENYPLRDFTGMISDLTSIVKDYSKLNKRNNKKDDAHLNKHAMHLIRLYLMCMDILEKEEIITYRGEDIPLLMAIRTGEFQQNDGSFRDEFFMMVEDYNKKMNYAMKNSSLPENPPMDKIEELIMGINHRSLY